MPGIHSGKVCIFGPGGSVAAVSAPVLAQRFPLLPADREPIEAVIARQRDPIYPSWKSAPLPPHEWVEVDITDYDQVERAMTGCDAVINLSVNRTEPSQAFRVNAVGVYNIMKAAVKLRPQRIVQTGVIMVWGYGHEGDLRYDVRVPEDMPLHPGSQLYALSKQLGLEIATIFSMQHKLDVLTMVFHRLRPHDALDNRDDNVVIPYSTAWDDLGDALMCALRAPTMPRPNEVFHICARMPMGKYAPDKAERLLGWRPKHNFERFYTRPAPGS
jgi:nucleoside-diphosphate-sugar epimerase